jgi:hypothetical protein
MLLDRHAALQGVVYRHGQTLPGVVYRHEQTLFGSSNSAKTHHHIMIEWYLIC